MESLLGQRDPAKPADFLQDQHNDKPL